MISNIISVVVTLVLIVLLGLLVKLPEHITNTWLEKTKNKNAHEIQIESYFKQLGGEQQQKVFSEWTSFITDMENTTKKYNVENIEEYRKLIHDTIVYGSNRTVNILSLYNQENYTHPDTVSDKMLVYMAFLISSLKYDFSGYYVEPLNLLKITLKDFNKNEVTYKKYALEIETQLKNME